MAPTVVVLGAGASHGAAVPREARLECLPPLNADFFTQLQRITTDKHKVTIERVINDVVQLFGSNFSLTLEDYFTQLEFLVQAVGFAVADPTFQRRDYVAKREHLMTALSAILEASTGRIINEGGCEHHAVLVNHLSGGDTIISFNYDCLIDDALRRHGDEKWHPRWGYRFPLRGYQLTGTEHWAPPNPARARDATISLLKVHGSLNWQLPEGGETRIRLKQRLHQQRGIPRFTIIPPVWNKAVDTQDIFRRVWQEAANRLRAARAIAIVGFSFVPTDLYAQSLFRIALGERSKLKRLIIANPNHEARVRIRQVFDVPLLEKGVLLRQYESFGDLVNALPEALT
jgi:hypothetical protein